MKNLFSVIALVIFLVASASADVTDDIINAAKTDPVTAAKIGTVPNQTRLQLENALSAFHDFYNAGNGVDLYRVDEVDDAKRIVIYVVGRGDVAKCLKLTFDLDTDLSRYNYSGAQTEIMDGHVAIAELFIESLRHSLATNTFVDGQDQKGRFGNLAQTFRENYQSQKELRFLFTMSGTAKGPTVSLTLNYNDKDGKWATKLIGHFHVISNEVGRLVISERVNFTRG